MDKVLGPVLRVLPEEWNRRVTPPRVSSGSTRLERESNRESMVGVITTECRNVTTTVVVGRQTTPFSPEDPFVQTI